MNAAWRTANGWAIELGATRDERIVRASPVGRYRMTQLITWAKAQLQKVAAKNNDVGKLVTMTKPDREGTRLLICGQRDGPSFQRKDGLRCHFIITLREVSDSLHVLSYTLHLDTPPGARSGPQFLRWEFSPFRNVGVDAVTEPLAHLHPGHDEVRLPSPVLCPKELITLFLGLELWH